MKPAPLFDFRTSVRELVEFVHRSGGLAGEGQFRAANRAVEGTRGHRRLQQARGDSYEAEVQVEQRHERENIRLLLAGRVDGVLEDGSSVIVEEIKTVDRHWRGVADPLHLAQLRIYAAMLADERGWETVKLHLTYLDFETDQETTLRSIESKAELAAFLERTLDEWFDWLRLHAAWLAERNASLETLSFPFGKFRGGQHELARSVYKAIRDHENRFIEAPTGLGKTLATLFPAVKALPLLREGQIFYVTAKTPGKLAAEDALGKLRAGGAKLRSLMLTAKHRLCFSENPSGCDLRACRYALGYYDRVKPAVRELLAAEHLDRAAVEAVARKHEVCPFELSLDASLWTDVVVGDFNYVFDPNARLQRHFADGTPRHIVLIDEAHNLVDRSREMYSASITLEELAVGKGAVKALGSGKARRALDSAREALASCLAEAGAEESVILPRPYHEEAVVLESAPKDLVAMFRLSARAIEAFLSDLPPGVDLSGWLEPWFALGAFLRAAESFDETCRTIVSPARSRVTLFCADPSSRLRETLKGLRSALFFSATLSPMDYFRDILGGTEEDRTLSFESPFDAEQMRLSIRAFDVTFKGRAASLASVGQTVAEHIRANPGNHLVFCPSLDYLALLENELRPLLEGTPLFSQTSLMNEEEREAFLSRFEPNVSQVGLAVLGGIFSEGIDLPGDRLIAVTVIGVGLPRLSLERDILLAHFQATRSAGFDYAYRFPGMQRVLQAVGRLIRTESDTGAALLVDHRFNERRYRVLFPAWWRVERRRAVPALSITPKG